jgi:hypothetical protein
VKHKADQLELFEVPRSVLPRKARSFPYLVVEATPSPSPDGGHPRALSVGFIGGDSRGGNTFDTSATGWPTDSTQTSAG